jgi:protein-S-isoprenylcysteine O-methyltransferase Ste14
MSVTTRGAPQERIRDHGARVLRIPPPLYYGAAFAAGIMLRAVSVPLAIGVRPATAVLGAIVLAVGVALALAGVVDVGRHRTTLVPPHPGSTLLTTGPNRITRNPMYTGLAIAYLGGAVLAGSWWPLATLPVALLAVRGVLIGPEERYLADQFGQTYIDYRARVRRWL